MFAQLHSHQIFREALLFSVTEETTSHQKGTTLATTRTTMSPVFTQHEGGADEADEATFITQQELSARIEAQRFHAVRWTVRLKDGFRHPDEPMTLSELFDYLEDELHVDPVADLETAAYFDPRFEQVIVVRPRGGSCDEALRQEVLRHLQQQDTQNN